MESTQLFWIFSHSINGTPVFERSTPYEARAKERVEELKNDHGYKKAFYTKELPTKYYY